MQFEHKKAPHEEGREGSGYAGTYYGIWNYCDCSFYNHSGLSEVGEVMLEAVCLLILAICMVIIVAVNVSMKRELRESIRKSME